MNTTTLLMTIAVTSAVLAITMGVVAYQRRLDGMQQWATSFTLHATVYSLYLLRGQISDVFTIVIANGLLAASSAVFTDGLLKFQNRVRPRWQVWLPVPVMLAAMLVWVHEPVTRVTVVGLILALQSLVILMDLLARRRDTVGVGQHILAAAFVLVLAMLTVRVLGTLLGATGIGGFTSASPLQAMTFLASLNAMVLMAVGVIVMTKERAEHQIQVMSRHDVLTGLPNRGLLAEHLEAAMAMARRQDQRIALMFLDLDRFKEVNDTLGHRMGDLLLKDVAQRLRLAVRESDVVARIGGDEFVVLLRDVPSTETVQAVGEKLGRALETPFDIEGHRLSVSASTGIALYPDHGRDATELFRRADQAMYRIKAQGRNGVAVAEPDAHDR